MKYHFSQEDSNNIFFTSDTHFNHDNILKYCSRPFKDIKEQDETLIHNWNNKVPSDGIVFHLGDVGFGSTDYVKDVLNQLNGKIYLIIGNHDLKSIVRDCGSRFELMTQQMNIRVGEQHIILNHYPLLAFSGAWRGLEASWQLFGHVHTSPYTDEGVDQQRMKYLFPSQYDVGVDNNDFTPISYNEVKKIIRNQQMSLGMLRNTI